jgi:hypothetical protein
MVCTTPDRDQSVIATGVPSMEHNQCSLLYFCGGTKFRFPRDLFGWAIAWDVAMPRRRINWKSEDVMAGLYLGIAVTGVNALVAMGIVIAFTGVGLF